MGLVPDKTITKIWRALPAQFGSVIGEEAKLAEPTLAREWSPDGARYFAELELVEPRSAKLYMVFDLALAIACAGRLMVRPAGAIRDNVASKTFDGDDLDAMGECVNTFCAAVNEGIRNVLGDEYRVVFRAGTREAPAVEGLGPLAVASAELVLGELARGTLELVVPEAAFTAAHDGEDDDDDDDDDGDDDDDDAADDDASADDDDAGGGPSGRKRKAKGKAGKKSKRGGKGKAGARGEAEGDGPLLTAEELAAIREATQGGLRGATMIVAPQEAHRSAWREQLGELGVELEFVADQHQLLARCRERAVDAVVIDADACPAGGLALLAALRGRPGAPARRIVVASQPTRTHLVACLGGGASEYLCRPLDRATLMRVIGAG